MCILSSKLSQILNTHKPFSRSFYSTQKNRVRGIKNIFAFCISSSCTTAKVSLSKTTQLYSISINWFCNKNHFAAGASFLLFFLALFPSLSFLLLSFFFLPPSLLSSEDEDDCWSETKIYYSVHINVMDIVPLAPPSSARRGPWCSYSSPPGRSQPWRSEPFHWAQ